MEPGIVTFRPDNFFTVGLIMLTVYLAAVAGVQAAMRFGLVSGARVAAPNPTNVTVVV